MTQEAIVERSEVGAAFSTLDLEQPYTDVGSQAEGTRVKDALFGGELALNNALTWTNLFANSARGVSDDLQVGDYRHTHEYPYLNGHSDMTATPYSRSK